MSYVRTNIVLESYVERSRIPPYLQKPVSVKKEQELQEVVTQELAQANKGDPESRRANKDAGRPSQRKTNSNIKSEHGDGKVTIKREKKIYEMPGQTRDTPDEVNCRILPLCFYLQE